MKQPYSYQKRGAQFLAERDYAGNFSVPGSGKTITAIEAARQLGVRRLVVVSPKTVISMWRDELKEEFELPTKVLSTTKTPIHSESGCYLMSYTMMGSRANQLKEWLSEERSAIIADESHHCKTWGTKRTEALNKTLWDIRDHHIWNLSGTPMTRWLDDMFPFLLRACPGELIAKIGYDYEANESLEQYLDRYQRYFCNMRLVIRGKSVYSKQREEIYGNKKGAEEEVNEMLYGGDKPPAFRLELKDLREALPPLTQTDYVIKHENSPELIAADKEVEAIKENAKMKGDTNPLMQYLTPQTTKLRRLTGLAKVKAAVEHIMEYVKNGGTPLLIGAWHIDVICQLQEQLMEHATHEGSVRIIYGNTPQYEREAIIKDFNNKRVPVLIGQIATMGTGINLQHGSNRVIVVEQSASPQDMEQFYARLHRIGQTLPVHIDALYADLASDRAMRDTAKAKRKAAIKLITQDT